VLRQGFRHALEHRMEQRRSNSARSTFFGGMAESVVDVNEWRRCGLRARGLVNVHVAWFAEAQEHPGRTSEHQSRRQCLASHLTTAPSSLTACLKISYAHEELCISTCRNSQMFHIEKRVQMALQCREHSVGRTTVPACIRSDDHAVGISSL
jgi:hypothetical protein